MIDRGKEDERERALGDKRADKRRADQKILLHICLIKHCERKADILICLKYRSAAAAEEKVFNQHFLGGSARRKTNINNSSSSRVCEADALELGF